MNLKPLDSSCLISIFTPGDARPIFDPEWKWFWQDSFHDVDEISKSGRYIPIVKQQAESMVAFIKKIKGRKINEAHIHCDAGISRSAAVAKFIMEYYDDDSFPASYTHYNKTVYRTLRKVLDFHADVSYEEWWKSEI